MFSSWRDATGAAVGRSGQPEGGQPWMVAGGS